jgi:hypothetical protein
MAGDGRPCTRAVLNLRDPSLYPDPADVIADERTHVDRWPLGAERARHGRGVARPEECEDLRSSLLRRIAVLCPFVGSAVGSRCMTARGYKKEIEWVLERDGWSTFGILT